MVPNACGRLRGGAGNRWSLTAGCVVLVAEYRPTPQADADEADRIRRHDGMDHELWLMHRESKDPNWNTVVDLQAWYGFR